MDVNNCLRPNYIVDIWKMVDRHIISMHFFSFDK